MIDTILILLRDWTVILITGMIFWLWEICYPLHEIKYKANFFRELGWAGISLVFRIIYAYVSVVIIKLLTFLFMGESATFAGLMYVPLWLRIITAYILQDFTDYTLHRIMHSNQFLWLTHKWHHSTKQSWWLSGNKDSFTGGLLYTVTSLWFPLMDIPLEIMSVVALHQVIHNNWIHLNVKWHSWLGILEWIYVTPRVHALHHIDTKGRNLSGMFTFTDRLFGTYVFPENFDLEKHKNRLDDKSVTVKTIVGV
ncbi:sterol desaturase family protein [Dolichospermum sp. LEGE 00240]|uniref:SxtD n=5 Tax=Aphanizomenon TaxID=1175 RepID=A0A1M4BLM7_9CYAN|nr:sterol desaturase family protein [Dolichospermum sp. LEGE 00240]ACG63804.1 SxtD [Aphanizomenon sp. NH-5]MDM3845051.1 sterol desaturase family protein [Aphanizomenon gracile PMC638.10]MDM3850943.1 sterol desaturase family protein [Aphanizomenon gracile PMC627.10]SAQ71107.1 SxtD [Aphanizomenon gracile NIVA-CYA 655]SAQ71135.1 SxtD [Aphanizomenon gracile UAM529]SAQ71163.1 SxtD [Aphanizomenon gracile NIVA-CYA 851]SAQ71191.1 SxtD [Aphanizomenon gracile NIVA-CYA 676]